MFIALVLLATFSPSSGIPLTSNRPLFHHNSWKRDFPSDPGGSDLRTTQDIVWSCIATIFACVWIAIHPNLPDPRSSGWTRFKHRTAVMALAVFAPEFIMVWALRQRLGAGRIMKEYNNAVFEVEEHQKSSIHLTREWFRDPPPPSKRQTWTLAHGFYVQMGGLLFCESETDWPVRVLHFHELLDLVQSGIVDPPNLTEEEIQDKSKGDFLTKSLVVLQTTWFIIQCMARWVAQLPVTELEIVTLSFAILNAITYKLWWEKPQNVAVGMRVQMKDIWRNRPSPPPQLDAGEASVITDYHPETIREDDGALRESLGQSNEGMGLEPDGKITWQSPQPTNPNHETGSIGHLSLSKVIWAKVMITARICSGTFYLLVKGTLKATFFVQLREVVLGTAPATVGVTTIRVTRPFGLNTPGPSTFCVAPGPLSVGTFYAYDSFDTCQKLGIIACAVTSGILFGGLHLVPWRFSFPTPAESLLWRISALYIMLNPIFISLPLIIFVVLSYRSNVDSEIRSAFLRWLPWVMPPIRTITITLPLYILARASIIILAFVTLRDLPPDAYKQISWDSFIPHI